MHRAPGHRDEIGGQTSETHASADAPSVKALSAKRPGPAAAPGNDWVLTLGETLSLPTAHQRCE
jgi:hypothetical protein